MLLRVKTELSALMLTASQRYRETYDLLGKTLSELRQFDAYPISGKPGMTGRCEEDDCYIVCVKRNGSVVMSILFPATGDMRLYGARTDTRFANDDDGFEQCKAAALVLLAELVPPSLALQLQD